MTSTPSSTAPHLPSGDVRPTLHERRAYVPVYPHEQFIVPMLARRIDQALRDIAAGTAFPATVLDAGCGEAPLRADLMDLGFSYNALDFQQNGSGTVNYICSIDESLPEILTRQSFDLIVCTEVLEHVADWNKAFSNFYNLLSPGGLLLITCPHSFPLHEEPYDFWRPTLHAIRYFAGRYGFEVHVAEKLGNGWDVMGTTLAMGNPKAGEKSLLSRIASRVGREVRGVVLPLFRLASHMSRRGPGVVYMSNFAILKKSE